MGSAWRRLLAAAALLAGLGMLLLALEGWQRARADRHAARAALESLRAEAQANTTRSQRQRSAEAERGAAMKAEATSAIVARLNIPWPRLLEALERSAPAAMTVTSMESDGKARRFTINAEGPAMPTLLDFAERLGKAPEFERVNLLQHEQREGERRPVVKLTVASTWGAGAAVDAGATR
ncbi:MAG: hypothetical protein KIT17_00500 [Rubrivivax sp.]|nr:hypothetical protein [Rubrivivax sp.]